MLLDDATPSDVLALVALINASYRTHGNKPGWTDEWEFLESTPTDADPLVAALPMPCRRSLLDEERLVVVARPPSQRCRQRLFSGCSRAACRSASISPASSLEEMEWAG